MGRTINPSGGRSAAFASNTLSSLLLMLANIIVGFIVPRTLIAVYGSEVNGLVSSLTQFVAYISLVEAGISSAAVFQLYQPLAKGDRAAVSDIVSAAKVFYYKSGAVFTVLVLALAVAYPLAVEVGSLGAVQVFVLVVALGATGFLDFFALAKYRVLLTATQNNWVIQLAGVAYKILYAAVVLLLAGKASVEVIYVAAIAPIVIRSLLIIAFAKKHYPDVDYSADRTGVKLEQRWDAFYLQVLGAVQTGAPVIIATFVLGDLAMVSVFSVYLLVANAVQNACAAFSQGTQASFGDVIARGQTEVLKRSFREFQVLVYGLAGVLCGVAIALIDPFIALYTADVADVDYVHPLIGALAMANVLLYHLKTPQGLLVISAGLYHDTRWQTTTQALVLLVLGSALGVFFGVPGILAGACVSNLYRDIDLAVFIPRRVTRTPVRETFGYMALAVAICAITAAPYLLGGFGCGGWAAWAASGAALLVWGAAVALVLLRIFAREQLSGLMGRVLRMLGVKRKGRSHE